MATARIALALALLLYGTTAARAQEERILDFSSDVELRPDSSLDVTETIEFQVLGEQIRHGINRDFPTDYPGPWGSRSTTGFTLEDVSLDGEAVPTQQSRFPNGVRIRIGDPDRLVTPGIHTYTIHYLTWWQVSFRPDADRLDWNVTGTGWEFPIDRAEFHLHGSGRLVRKDVRYFTGPQGSQAADAAIVALSPGVLDVVTTQPLPRHSGLTVAASFPKGVLEEPSRSELTNHWIADNLPVFTSLLGLLSVACYVGWLSLGSARPPAAIIPQFSPPSGFSPAMVGYLEDMGISDRDFSAGIVGLAVARHLKLVHDNGVYRLVRQPGGQPVTELETKFESVLFRADDELSVSAANGDRVAGARTALGNFLRMAMMPALLRREPRNARRALALAAVATVLTVGALAFEFGAFAGVLALMIGFGVLGGLALLLAAVSGPRAGWVPVLIGLVFLSIGLLPAYLGGVWLLLVAISVVATAVLAAASFRHLTVPTAEGWKRRDEIEGLKLFLGVAEAERLRILNPSDFTLALYEKLLPYAIALGVEMVWSRRFAAALAASQIEYQPDWYDGSHPWSTLDGGNFSSDLGGGLAAAISAASTSPSASSDGSGGGDSGGGGGGGGGGSGW